jgi:uncharacterized protein (TIGR03083 family)
MSEPHAVSYAALRERVSDLLLSADHSALQAAAPATPGWTGLDIVAHIIGVSDDVVNGRLDGITTEPWTRAQVEKRKGSAAADLVAEWAKTGPAFEAMLSGAPAEISGQALFDAATHEHDLRNALRTPGARDSDAMEHAWVWFVGARAAAGGAALRFVTEHDDVVAGKGQPAATVRASRFEVLRAATGRRSAAEIAAYDWDPDVAPETILAAPIFSLRDTPLNE